jgi:hypothetical protein
MGRNQHLIPWANAGRDQGKMQSRRTGVDADCMCDAKIVGDRVLKSFDERSEAKCAVFKEAADIRQSLLFDLSPLNREIGKRNNRVTLIASR